MNRLEHGTNPYYKYIASDNPEQISAGKNEINLVIFDYYLQ